MENTELIPLQIEDKIIEIRNQNVILDYDVAALYHVQTMRINEAVKNNPDKFPKGYVFELQTTEKQEVIENFDNLKPLKFSPKNPVAFTEKGLYMLATILKSPQATQTTIAIVEAFAKLRELSQNLIALGSSEEDVVEPEVLQSAGGLLKDLLFSTFPQSSAGTSLEVNLGIMKLKREIKNEPPAVSQDIQNRFDQLEQMIRELKRADSQK